MHTAFVYFLLEDAHNPDNHPVVAEILASFLGANVWEL